MDGADKGRKTVARQRGSGWQAEKSSAMRSQILASTIRCLVRLGYVRTSTKEISAEAGVSRGAMTHHFKTKEDLINATVEYLTNQRIESFRQRVAAIRPSEHADEMELAHLRLEEYWAHLMDPMFIAFQELLFASRTDAALAAVLVPAARRFETQWLDMIQQTMPDWNPQSPLWGLTMDLTQYLMEGMAMHTLIDPSPQRYASLRRYLQDRLVDIKSWTQGNGDTATDNFLKRAQIL